MSQQHSEFEDQQSSEDIHQPQYPYSWSEQPQAKGLPRDEPPGNYRQSDEQTAQPESRAGVPWWARPQWQEPHNNARALVFLLVILIVVAILFGGMGIVGLLLGGLIHILGILLEALLAFILVLFLAILLAILLIVRTLRKIFAN